MNCECFYLIKENTMDAARDLAKRIDKTAYDRMMELFPVCISQAKRDFLATGDYDNCGREFLVKEGSYMVFVSGKYHSMCEIRPRGGKRGFPVFDYDMFSTFIQDVEEL